MIADQSKERAVCFYRCSSVFIGGQLSFSRSPATFPQHGPCGAPTAVSEAPSLIADS
jgi:hypothetical protein